MLAGAWIAWDRQEPFMSPLEVARVTTAATYAAGTSSGTTLVFLVNQDDPALTFLATRAANVIRAGMPPDRIRHVVIRVPWPNGPATTERWKLAHLTRDDARAAERSGNGQTVTFVLAPFDRTDLPTDPGAPGLVSDGVLVSSPTLQPRAVADPLEPSSPVGIAIATLATLALLVVAGYGWSRASLANAVSAVALSPAFGVAALTIAAIALERLGVPLTGAIGPIVVSAVSGLGGYAVWFVLERRARAGTTP
jgi:hypothetical protein